jgi:hypothetical protein
MSTAARCASITCCHAAKRPIAPSTLTDFTGVKVSS